MSCTKLAAIAYSFAIVLRHNHCVALIVLCHDHCVALSWYSPLLGQCASHALPPSCGWVMVPSTALKAAVPPPVRSLVVMARLVDVLLKCCVQVAAP